MLQFIALFAGVSPTMELRQTQRITMLDSTFGLGACGSQPIGACRDCSSPVHSTVGAVGVSGSSILYVDAGDTCTNWNCPNYCGY